MVFWYLSDRRFMPEPNSSGRFSKPFSGADLRMSTWNL